MTFWISVNEKLPELRQLVWIHVCYEKSPYDNVTERVSIGCRIEAGWWDALDFPFADDYKVVNWMPLIIPELP